MLKKTAPLIRFGAAAFNVILCTWAFIVTAGFFKTFSHYENIGAVLIISAHGLVLFFSVLVPSKKDLPAIISRAGAGTFLIVYPGLFFIFLIKVTGLPYPAFLLLYLILSVFVSDALAYLAGNFFGKHTKIITEISPNKTLVGFITQLIFASLVSIATALLFPVRYPFSPFWAGLFGLGLGVTALIGDLFESALKRAAKVKDSGRIIPGRGGFLDSLDSLLLSAPFFYFVLTRVS